MFTQKIVMAELAKK